MNDGTNFAPMSVVGFRNGQGIPGLTVLFTSIEGLSSSRLLSSLIPYLTAHHRS